MFGSVSKELHDQIAGGAMRSSARNYAEQALLTRLELTSFLRAVTPLACDAADPNDAFRGWWFKHGILGMSIGLVEALRLPNAEITPYEAQPAEWARRLLGDRKARLIVEKTLLWPDEARAAPGSVPVDEVRARDGLLEMQFVERYSDVLLLRATFEQTVAGLSHNTRHNVRRFTKRMAQDGVTFALLKDEPTIDSADVYALAQQTRPYPIPARRIKKYERFSRIAGRPFRSLMKDKSGRLISYGCGFTDGSSAYVILQLNHMDWHARSPSLVHRGHLMRCLIEEGIERIVFPHGCAGMLAHACLPTFVRCRWLLRSDASTKLLAAAAAKLLPAGYYPSMAQQMLQKSKSLRNGTAR